MAKTLAELLAEARGRIDEVDPSAAAQALEADPEQLLLDVREPEEWAQAHLRGALHVPRGMLEPRAAADSKARLPELSDPGRPILVYCGSGLRSAFAADRLRELGFTRVRSLAGGIGAWQKAGLPVES